jgi:hypothetical protein
MSNLLQDESIGEIGGEFVGSLDSSTHTATGIGEDDIGAIGS